MKAVYEFMCKQSGQRHSVTFRDKPAATIEQSVQDYVQGTNLRINDWRYSE